MAKSISECDSDNSGVQDIHCINGPQRTCTGERDNSKDSVKDAQKDTGQTQESSKATAAGSNSAEDASQSDFLQAWKESSHERPLRVLVCGLSGVGKTTLINRLLQSEERGEKRKSGGENTKAVLKYETTTNKSGVKVCIFDTPGFNNANVRDETIIAMMEDRDGEEIRHSVLLYHFEWLNKSAARGCACHENNDTSVHSDLY